MMGYLAKIRKKLVKYPLRCIFTDFYEVMRYFLCGGFEVVFYCRLKIHEDWIATTLEAISTKYSCALVLDYKKKESSLKGKVPIFRVGWFGMPLLKTKVAISAATRPAGVFPVSIAPIRIHMPHSLVSLHMIYAPNSFRNYNALFCAGPHHCEEILRLREIEKDNMPMDVYRVGYGKYDIMCREYLQVRKLRRPKKNERHMILLAPSWGESNILETIGLELVDALVEEGYEIVIRPHPLFMSSESFVTFNNKYSSNHSVTIENPWLHNKALYICDLMISDYSGVAYEYAFLRELPVVFVDVPIKENNRRWKEIDITPMELSLREVVGVLCEPKVDLIIEGVNAVMQHMSDYKDQIRNIRDNYIYNPCLCSQAASERIDELISRGG